MIPIGVMMRRARVMRRLSQTHVAKLTGTTQSAVSEWELGLSVPTIDSLRRFSEALGFKMEISFTPVELADEAAWPWEPKGSIDDTTFGHGPVEEESDDNTGQA